MNAIYPETAGRLAAHPDARTPYEVRRYHPALVVLHWLLAAMLLFMMVGGGLVLQPMPNASPDKLGVLRGHMIGGAAVLVLMLACWAVRRRTPLPPAALTGRVWTDRIAPWMHQALYAIVFAMALSGFALSVTCGLGQVVFGSVGGLPENFDAFAARAVHGFVAKVLLALVTVHVAAALYHHGVRKDGLLLRMKLGRRSSGDAK